MWYVVICLIVINAFLLYLLFRRTESVLFMKNSFENILADLNSIHKELKKKRDT
jgi:hypothetical protein